MIQVHGWPSFPWIWKIWYYFAKCPRRMFDLIYLLFLWFVQWWFVHRPLRRSIQLYQTIHIRSLCLVISIFTMKAGKNQPILVPKGEQVFPWNSIWQYIFFRPLVLKINLVLEFKPNTKYIILCFASQRVTITFKTVSHCLNGCPQS